MFEPTRGGTRGGQAEFKWSDVSADKDREHYLGHSINAPTGRWQKNKDVHWYNRDQNDTDAERAAEIRKVKEAEAEALSAALGFAPAPKALGDTPASGANATGAVAKVAPDEASRALEKEEKRRKKAEHKEEKRAKKEARRAERSITVGMESEELERRRRRDRSRSRSPRGYRIGDQDVHLSRRHRSRSRSPRRHSRSHAPPGDSHYDATEREKERDRDRRRWDSHPRRELPSSGSRWGRE